MGRSRFTTGGVIFLAQSGENESNTKSQLSRNVCPPCLGLRTGLAGCGETQGVWCCDRSRAQSEVTTAQLGPCASQTHRENGTHAFRHQILYFFSSGPGLLHLVGLLGFSMSTTWTHATMECAADSANATFANGTATITLDLFDMISERKSCPSIGRRPEEFKVFTELGKVGTAPQVPTAWLSCCWPVSAGGPAAAVLIALYNSVSNPYETYWGHWHLRLQLRWRL
ncbi:unnamed protein product [Boreogadus saida]